MKKKVLLIIILLVITMATGTYFYLYQGHRDVTTTASVETFDSQMLLGIFQDDDSTNDKRALDQVITVTGTVTSQNGNQVTLDDQIFIQMKEVISLPLSSKVAIKGRCLGYDELLEEIKIDQATKH